MIWTGQEKDVLLPVCVVTELCIIVLIADRAGIVIIYRNCIEEGKTLLLLKT